MLEKLEETKICTELYNWEKNNNNNEKKIILCQIKVSLNILLFSNENLHNKKSKTFRHKLLNY